MRGNRRAPLVGLQGDVSAALASVLITKLYNTRSVAHLYSVETGSYESSNRGLRWLQDNLWFFGKILGSTIYALVPLCVSLKSREVVSITVTISLIASASFL